MKSIALWLVVIVTCITGWSYGFSLAAILSLFVGIEHENIVYKELLTCKFTGIRSYRVADIHYFKKYTLRLLIFILILISAAITLGLTVDFPDWIKYVAYIIILIFVYGCTYIFSRYLAFFKYENYLKRFLSKEPEEWDDEDRAFVDRLNKQQDTYPQDKQFREDLEKFAKMYSEKPEMFEDEK
ncbi:MAG: hypothetical protein LBJ63_04090 [Prevotellaceae bacterium]|jgi:hypothetical protein|nr:hypothetical protein [Prevotellaceae bacterium]